jgi:hypothetical protein
LFRCVGVGGSLFRHAPDDNAARRTTRRLSPQTRLRRGSGDCAKNSSKWYNGFV